MKKFLFVDTETTGLDPKVNGIHQISGVLVIEGRDVETFDFKFKPLPSEKIEKEALAVSGLTEDDIDGREMTSVEAYRKFNTMMTSHIDKYNKEDKAVIGGYNCGFDAQFLNEWYVKNGNKFFFGLFHGGAYLDGLLLALMLEIKRKERIFRPNRKLETVAKHLGIKLDNAHDAMADITATRKVIKTLWSEVVS